ncbi:hypothetical protein H5T56_05820 [Candidatus Bipolaricaulota bacterium]|nr:hypothetical protein [Candidatus Bipolaricaulota bacterium]
MRKALAALAVFGFVLLGQGIEELLAQADRLYDRWSGGFDFVVYEGRLREAIRLWEEALPKLSGEARREVLIKLSRAYFELAEAYLSEREKEPAYGKGKDYALLALRMDPEFVQVEGREGHRAALRAAKDVEALFWYGNNLGRWLSFHWFSALAGGSQDVLAAFERAAELDEGYWGGGPRRALGNFHAQTPGFLGGDQAQVEKEFLRAIELDPDFLQNLVDYAELWAKDRDKELFCRLIAEALKKAPEAQTKWPLYNHLALERARKLASFCP